MMGSASACNRTPIRYASLELDWDFLVRNDHHVTADILREKVLRQEVIVICDRDQPIGWLRFGYFWDLIPMMNMLAVAETHQRKGWGTQLVQFWETEMKKQGHTQVFTSTLADENAQHFYRKLGYQDTGALFLPEEALEIIFRKKI
jgi:ribosomal protein S18 acetylase RimI-like enzyme